MAREIHFNDDFWSNLANPDGIFTMVSDVNVLSGTVKQYKRIVTNGHKLKIPNGISFQNVGTILNSGELVIEGKLINGNGSINSKIINTYDGRIYFLSSQPDNNTNYIQNLATIINEGQITCLKNYEIFNQDDSSLIINNGSIINNAQYAINHSYGTILSNEEISPYSPFQDPDYPSTYYYPDSTTAIINITANLNLPSDSTFNILDDQQLTIGAGVVLTNYGTINVDSSGNLNNMGTLTNNDTIINNGTITNNGTINNNGVILSNSEILGTAPTSTSQNEYYYPKDKIGYSGKFIEPLTNISLSFKSTFTVKSGQTLLLDNNITFVNDGTVINNGTVWNYAVFNNNYYIVNNSEFTLGENSISPGRKTGTLINSKQINNTGEINIIGASAVLSNSIIQGTISTTTLQVNSDNTDNGTPLHFKPDSNGLINVTSDFAMGMGTEFTVKSEQTLHIVITVIHLVTVLVLTTKVG